MSCDIAAQSPLHPLIRFTLSNQVSVVICLLECFLLSFGEIQSEKKKNTHKYTQTHTNKPYIYIQTSNQWICTIMICERQKERCESQKIFTIKQLKLKIKLYKCLAWWDERGVTWVGNLTVLVCLWSTMENQICMCIFTTYREREMENQRERQMESVCEKSKY